MFAIGQTDKTWKAAAEATDGMEEWMETVRGLLPSSLRYYADYLLEQQDYDRWADVHIAWETNPDDYDPAGVRRVEKAGPRALLPLYHGRVWQAIDTRSRQGYKDAVREMKKLKKLYVRLKIEPQWSQFVARLTVQYGRLRALQEEMRKSGLIT